MILVYILDQVVRADVIEWRWRDQCAIHISQCAYSYFCTFILKGWKGV